MPCTQPPTQDNLSSMYRLAAGMGLLCLVLHIASCQKSPPASTRPLRLFAASSTASVLQPLAREFERRTGHRVNCNFASSSTLAHQVLAGVDVDLFLSAHPRWLAFLQKRGALKGTKRTLLLHNRLALIAPHNSKVPPGRPALSTLRALKQRVALGDPAHVPLGLYAVEALKKLGWWTQLKDRLLPSKDARSALHFVELGEAALGFAYKTDAINNKNIRLLYLLPASAHAPIRYPMLLFKPDSKRARALYRFLQSPFATKTFRRAGFGLPSRRGHR